MSPEDVRQVIEWGEIPTAPADVLGVMLVRTVDHGPWWRRVWRGKWHRFEEQGYWQRIDLSEAVTTNVEWFEQNKP